MKNLISCILLSIGLLAGQHVLAQQLEVHVIGLRNSKGVIILNLYTDAESFNSEIPKQVLTFPKTGLKDDCFIIHIPNLPYGEYGIALIDDENNNGKLDFRLIVPREGFAFSNHPFTKHRKPDFESFSFEHIDCTLVRFEVYYFTGQP